jgi:Tetratricopeptide repeat
MRNPLIVVALITPLLLGATASAEAQPQDRPAQSDSAQPVPDAPQPQKKPAAKPQSDASAGSPTSAPAPPPDKSTQAPTKDANPFPESVSRAAAKQASDTSGSPDSSSAGKSGAPASDSTPGLKRRTADDNPFPESVSRDAAKAAGNSSGSDSDTDPKAGGKNDLPPGVSSSRSTSTADDEPGEGATVTDPVRAQKDTAIGGFYLQSGNYQGALLRYKEAMASDPANVDAIFGLAETQRMLKQNAEAARNYQLYLDIVPNGPKAKQALKALKALGTGK